MLEKTWKKNVHFRILRRLGKRLRILQSFFRANNFRILLDGGATDLLYGKNLLRNHVPGHGGVGQGATS
jgi:hypothetical protein